MVFPREALGISNTQLVCISLTGEKLILFTLSCWSLTCCIVTRCGQARSDEVFQQYLDGITKSPRR